MTTQPRTYLTSKQILELEALIDASCLWNVVAELADIATQKANHIRENWQDPETAKPWDKAAAALDRLYPKIDV